MVPARQLVGQSDSIKDSVREAAAAAVAPKAEQAGLVAEPVTLNLVAEDGVHKSVCTHLVVPHCIRMRQWWR